VFSSALGTANFLTAYGRLLCAVWRPQIDVQMEGSPPLYRTRAAPPETGPPRTTVARVGSRGSDAPVIWKCLQGSVKGLGLDIAFQPGGALKGAGVSWTAIGASPKTRWPPSAESLRRSSGCV